MVETSRSGEICKSDGLRRFAGDEGANVASEFPKGEEDEVGESSSPSLSVNLAEEAATKSDKTKTGRDAGRRMCCKVC